LDGPLKGILERERERERERQRDRDREKEKENEKVSLNNKDSKFFISLRD